MKARHSPSVLSFLWVPIVHFDVTASRRSYAPLGGAASLRIATSISLPSIRAKLLSFCQRHRRLLPRRPFDAEQRAALTRATARALDLGPPHRGRPCCASHPPVYSGSSVTSRMTNAGAEYALSAASL